jgi:hypothetical protein
MPCKVKQLIFHIINIDDINDDNNSNTCVPFLISSVTLWTVHRTHILAAIGKSGKAGTVGVLVEEIYLLLKAALKKLTGRLVKQQFRLVVTNVEKGWGGKWKQYISPWSYATWSRVGASANEEYGACDSQATPRVAD